MMEDREAKEEKELQEMNFFILCSLFNLYIGMFLFSAVTLNSTFIKLRCVEVNVD